MVLLLMIPKFFCFHTCTSHSFAQPCSAFFPSQYLQYNTTYKPIQEHDEPLSAREAGFCLESVRYSLRDKCDGGNTGTARQQSRVLTTSHHRGKKKSNHFFLVEYDNGSHPHHSHPFPPRPNAIILDISTRKSHPLWRARRRLQQGTLLPTVLWTLDTCFLSSSYLEASAFCVTTQST